MGYKGKKRGPGESRLLVIFLTVALLFATAWLAFELFGRMFSAQEKEPETPEPLPSSMMDGIIEGMPRNTYDLDAFGWKDGFLRYNGNREARQGVDVSFHQGEVDWSAVKKSGVEFAMIRVAYRGYTEGKISMDPNFVQNIEGALANGIDVGVYLFSQAVSEEEAREEAQYVLDAIEGYEITYPVMFDWEEIVGAEARTDTVDNETLSAGAAAFCEVVDKAGYTAGVYFNQRQGYQHYDLLLLKDYVFWLAQYDDEPTFYYDFQMWQYTDAGTVDGIEGSVDLNLSFWKPE